MINLISDMEGALDSAGQLLLIAAKYCSAAGQSEAGIARSSISSTAPYPV